ncbi:MAG: molybdopterin molybdotransferase MoeA [Gammaproteobacteria bacterium]|nr:MAG: molybdopterin molybdotransferase MoeA [Gammaproteobacteria bacterium]
MAAAPRQRISVEEATALIAAAMPRWPARRVTLEQALGAVLREDLLAERDQPPFDRVTMDGIAVASGALAGGRRDFELAGTQAAGAAALAIADAGQCLEVMTGSVLPAGTDTVIPVERITRSGRRAVIAADYSPRAGQFVHRRGSDHRQGERLLAAGSVIGPPEMAILALGGRAEVSVGAWPRIAVISTGDELVSPGAPIGAAQIRSSNDLAIAAALRRRGFPEVSRSLLRDDPEQLVREIGHLHETNEVLVLSGGVSMGQFDHVPATLAALGVEAIFHKVLQRPGLPLWFGRSSDGRLVFALPGNPVSSLVCLVRYVLPGLALAMGAGERPARYCRLSAPVDFTADLTCFLPVMLACDDDGEVTAVPRPTNTSGDFVALGGTDGFVELPRGRDHFPAGYAARFHAW